ncbi:MAG: hypothetical protein ACOH2V_00070 [Candidatus Saccharimonadaceae bacterium]
MSITGSRKKDLLGYFRNKANPGYQKLIATPHGYGTKVDPITKLARRDLAINNSPTIKEVINDLNSTKFNTDVPLHNRNRYVT